MLSRFFIDRPIFATVLSIIIALAGAITVRFLPITQYPQITPPGVQVSITYPGASAQVVADTVAAPIEQQVNGIEGMLYMSSQSANDGTYTLQVTFEIGTDTNTALVIVQNRVALAMQQLPIQVQNQGITIRKKTPDILLVVNFYSPTNIYDDVYLSNYALISVKDELLRVYGVSDITFLGERDYSIRAWLDPQELAGRNMSVIEVANAIQNQNLAASPGQIGQPPVSRRQSGQFPIDTLGRLTEPEQFGDIIIKVGGLTSAAPPRPSTTPASTNNFGLPIPGAMPPALDTETTATPEMGSTESDNAPSPGTTTTETSAVPTIMTPVGGATTTGGANTSGGANTGGGGSTSGGANTNTSTAPGGATTSLTNMNTSPSVITTMNAAPPATSASIVRLRDVARVELGALNYNQACTFDGHPSVGLAVWQLPQTNALDVAKLVKDKMEELKKRFPAGVEYDIAYDTTPYISESIDDVVITLLEAVALVGFVVLIFLQDWRAMILPLIDVPVSIIGTFAVMGLLGFSLNIISLFGLVLAIGIVVDDAIVVLENIERIMATGLDARTATLKAMDEVTGPIIAVSLVLCAVFVPCAFVSGITGRFFHQFAVTIAVSTLISAINAVTMTPSRAVLLFQAAASRASKGKTEKEALPWWILGVVCGVLAAWLAPAWTGLGFSLLTKPMLPYGISPLMCIAFVVGAVVGAAAGRIVIPPINAVLRWCFKRFNDGFDWITAGYAWTVGKSLHHSPVMLMSYAVLLVLTVVVFHRAPTGFIPQQDMGRFIVNIQLPDSASLQRTRDAVALVEKITKETPGVSHTVTMSGLSFLLQVDSPNLASMFVVLDPFDKRRKPELSDQAIMARLRKEWARQVQDALVTAYPAAPLPGIGAAGGFKFAVEDRGGLGLDALQHDTDGLIRDLKAKPGLIGVNTQFRASTPMLYLDIDRPKVAALGVSLNDVNQSLDMYLGSLYVNSFNEFGRHWQVTIQADSAFRDRVEQLNLIAVRNNAGQMVTIGTMADVREVKGPIAITRYNLYASAMVNGNMGPATSSGDAIQTIDQTADQSLPLTMKTEWTELMFLQIRSGNTALIIFALGVVCVFLTLAALYENWSLPLAVILVVPLCLLCSLAGVLVTHRDVNIFVQIGLVVLVGLACKNAILVVEYARQLTHEGRSVFDATIEASRLRLRPILMTSLAFIFGVFPLVFAVGAGAEMRRSLGTAVFSGMLGVTLFGIFLTPIFFYVIQELGMTRLFRAVAATGWIGSTILGSVMGLASGYLVGLLGIVRMPWALVSGTVVCGLLVLAVVGIHRLLGSRPTAGS